MTSGNLWTHQSAAATFHDTRWNPQPGARPLLLAIDTQQPPKHGGWPTLLTYDTCWPPESATWLPLFGEDTWRPLELVAWPPLLVDDTHQPPELATPPFLLSYATRQPLEPPAWTPLLLLLIYLCVLMVCTEQFQWMENSDRTINEYGIVMEIFLGLAMFTFHDYFSIHLHEN